MLMQRRARYRLGPVYEIINNRVSPVAIIFTSTLLRRYTVSPGYTLCVAPFRYIRWLRDLGHAVSQEFCHRIDHYDLRNDHDSSYRRSKRLCLSLPYLNSASYLFLLVF